MFGWLLVCFLNWLAGIHLCKFKVYRYETSKQNIQRNPTDCNVGLCLGRYCSGAADYDVFPVYHARAGAELWSGLHVRLPQATFPVGCAAQRQHQQRVSNRFSSHSSNTACTWEYFGGFRRVLCALSCPEVVRAGSGSDGDLCCIKRPNTLC